MNKHLRNMLTISATTLMMLGFGGMIGHMHTHACTTAFNEVDDSASSQDVNNQVQNDENNYTTDDNANYNDGTDAQDFLENNGNSTLFNHYYLNPCEEQQYKVKNVSDLADQMALDPSQNTDENRANIAGALNSDELNIYNDVLSTQDGTDSSLSIDPDDAASSDNVPLTTDQNSLDYVNGVNDQLNNAENDNSDVNDAAYNDVHNFLNNNVGDYSGNGGPLFNDHGYEGQDQLDYTLDIIAQLADQMATSPDELSSNVNNIENSLTPKELEYYNIRLGEDGAKLNTYVDQSPYNYADTDDDTDDESTAPSESSSDGNDDDEPSSTSTTDGSDDDDDYTSVVHHHRARHARYGYYRHGYFIHYQTGYFNKRGTWIRYKTGYYTKSGRWIRRRARRHYRRHYRHYYRRHSHRRHRRHYYYYY